MAAPSIRARVRSEMNREIKEVARRRLAADGANLSLRAVARDMGMVASALYRYFPSRDALLTALIVDAYGDLRDAARTAAAAIPDDRPRARWLAVGHAVRAWALAHPAEYGLVYGTPVPGYSAPPETTAPAAEVILLLAEIAAAHATPPADPVPAAYRSDLEQLIDAQPGGIAPELLDRVLLAWTQLFGAVSFELFGRLDGMVAARAEYFDRHLRLIADLVGLPR
ncbi:TetR/AcrR family transcriptional regulator [Nocardia sp. NPDC057227]|uniref:TetR/AcrR family transcriptional regulator n=1 Tax=Nocardia sp. NPDC057227 TaxID=3346056 RepID=UPI003645928D